MNWTLSEIAKLRGVDAVMFAAFCLAAGGLYYSLRGCIRSR